MREMMAIIIAGERSGVGKTTVTLALLAILRRRYANRIQSFKVGPDYIDPMFHQFVTGQACRNLDPVLTSETYVCGCFQRHCQSAEYALVEGVMGLFDGVTGKQDWASTAHIARLLNLPIVLVINCSSMAGSIAAIAHGYTTLDPRLKFAGVVLNRVGSDRHLELLQDALASLHLPILGVLRRQDEIQIPDRHLGLIPTAELPQLQSVIDRLAHLGETCFNWDLLLPLLAPSAGVTVSSSPPIPQPTLRLAIARDQAFSFYYADNLDLLESVGFELVPWSPMQDAALPKNIQGLYFGGGFPEVFAEALSESQPAREAVKAAVTGGMPTYAECGGLMYLSDRIRDFDNKAYPMVGIFPTEAQMGKTLTLGYRQATVQPRSLESEENSFLLAPNETVWGHEFHRSSLTTEPEQPLFKMQNYDGTLHKAEGWRRFQAHASYLHLHFGEERSLLQRWINQCYHYQIGLESQQ
jgi:cobyrinic acid a,c-diamide synthase